MCKERMLFILHGDTEKILFSFAFVLLFVDVDFCKGFYCLRKPEKFNSC